MAAGPFDTCVFVHGAGNHPEAYEPSVLDSFPAYWGSVEDRVSCSKKLFMNMDTTTRAWDDASLAQSFCAAAQGVCKPSCTSRHSCSLTSMKSQQASSIANTIVFTHGSGNLIVGNAVASNLCSFDSTSSWVELQV